MEVGETFFPHFLDEESVTWREINGLRVTKPGLELTSLDPQTVHFMSPQVDTQDVIVLMAVLMLALVGALLSLPHSADSASLRGRG